MLIDTTSGSIANGWMGIHGWEMPVESYKMFSFVSSPPSILFPSIGLIVLYPKWNGYVNLNVYAFTPWACKTVILMFYLDIGGVSTKFRWSVYFTMFVVSGVGISIFFSSLFPCHPIQRAYDFSISGTCYNLVAQYEACAILNVITDLIIIAIPIPMVIKLHAPIRRKIGLMALFLVGSV